MQTRLVHAIAPVGFVAKFAVLFAVIFAVIFGLACAEPAVVRDGRRIPVGQAVEEDLRRAQTLREQGNREAALDVGRAEAGARILLGGAEVGREPPEHHTDQDHGRAEASRSPSDAPQCAAAPDLAHGSRPDGSPSCSARAR